MHDIIKRVNVVDSSDVVDVESSPLEQVTKQLLNLI